MGSKLLLFFHANAEDLGHVYWFLRRLRLLLRVHILAMEYPGYGICTGEASEESVLRAAEDVCAFALRELQVPPAQLLLMGRSVGGGPAIHLAARQGSAGLITLSTFSSIRAVVGHFVGWGGWFPDIFDNDTRIRQVRCPTLIVHGDADETVDVE